MLRNRSRMIPGQCAEAATSSRISWLNRNGIHHRDGSTAQNKHEVEFRLAASSKGRRIRLSAPFRRSRARRIPEPSCGPNWRTKPSAHAVGFPLANWRSGHSDEKGGRQGEIEDEAALNDQLSRNSLDKIASSLRGVLPYLFCRPLLGAASLPCLGLEKAS